MASKAMLGEERYRDHTIRDFFQSVMVGVSLLFLCFEPEALWAIPLIAIPGIITGLWIWWTHRPPNAGRRRV